MLLNEFCSAVERGEREAGTAWGELLTFGEAEQLNPAQKAAKRKKKLGTELAELKNVAAKVAARIKLIEAELRRG